MSVRKGAPQFSSLLSNCVCWFTGQETNEFPIIPTGVTVTNNGTFTKTDLGNNKSVLNFDGSTNYITVGTVSTFNFLHQVGTTGKWSIAAWVKCNGFTTNQRIITTSRGSTSNRGFTLSISNTTRIIYFEIVYGSSGNYIVASSGSNIFPNDSDWHYLILTYDQSLASANCKVYLDGALNETASKTANTPSTSDASYAATIGGQPTTNILNGNMKDMMIWNNRVLTLPEIKLLMNRTHPITGAGLMPSSGEYYRLS